MAKQLNETMEPAARELALARRGLLLLLGDSIELTKRL